ncbi:hypothetical protein KHA80_16125 [Anaerobacillus sp. HL2]|nr:hypothetical protein KHA80_16125 [Anaerobacillus sp. HL2]
MEEDGYILDHFSLKNDIQMIKKQLHKLLSFIEEGNIKRQRHQLLIFSMK